MAEYFTITHGLRGCYADGESVYVVKVHTRRELRRHIESEADSYRDAGYVGASKRAVAWLANTAWKEARKPRPAVLPYVLPLAPPHARKNYAYGVFVSVATRAEYLERMVEES